MVKAMFAKGVYEWLRENRSRVWGLHWETVTSPKGGKHGMSALVVILEALRRATGRALATTRARRALWRLRSEA